MKLLKGNCIEVLKTLEENSVDSVVTDPPYEIGFMGKSWDSSGIANNPEMWKECLRVLKPGGYLLSFSATRTYHRMAVGIEDAGFEIRDMIEWVYGSGFPKSHNIGKAVDKLGGRGLGQEIGNIIKQRRIELGYSTIKLAEIGGFYGNTNHGGTVSNWETGNGSITPEQFNKLIDILGLENEPVIAKEREIIGTTITNKTVYQNIGGTNISGEINITKGTSEYEGWGTALKPAHEPICMARKPLAEKTVAENCLKWGTGGINIDESRVAIDLNIDDPRLGGKGEWHIKREQSKETVSLPPMTTGSSTLGRFPANLIHDNSEEVRACFPDNIRMSSCVGIKRTVNYSFNVGESKEQKGQTISANNYGNASRYFKSIIYQAKPSKKERNAGCEELEEKVRVFNGQSDKPSEDMKDVEKRFTTLPKANNHPTVKPIALMEYLIKMVTPKGGVVLDPFMGSGTTGCASVKNGFDFIGIDLEDEYIKIATARINHFKIF